MTKPRIHCMGILGSGTSAAAVIAKFQGYHVSGCDPSQYSEFAAAVHEADIAVEPRHSASHIRSCDMLVVSPAVLSYDPGNEELLAAKQANIPILTWQQLSGQYLQQDKFVIAIAGTHGKSTTTAITGLILELAGLDPTVQLGAIVPKWRKNVRLGKSKYYIIEADEFNDNFLAYHPAMIGITNIEYDHPEYFIDEAAVLNAFRAFCQQCAPHGTIFGGAGVAEQLNNLPVQTIALQDLSLHIPGEFNRANASLAFAIAEALGINAATAKRAINRFTGIGRRFSLAGEVKQIKIYDDYGHHPTALLETAKAARSLYPSAVIHLVFQPHMFTRTRSLLKQFTAALREAPVDAVYVTDIFAAREHDAGVISAKDLVHAVAQETVVYSGSLTDTEALLLARIQPGDIVICMGAGDIIELSKHLVTALTQKYG